MPRETPQDNAGVCKSETPEALFYRGICYAIGQGVVHDQAEAVRLFRKAAEGGFANAQYSLGACYDSGLGVETDFTEAAKWFQKAAEQGHARAQYKLGFCYEYGIGVDRGDKAKALIWYRKAAEQGEMPGAYERLCVQETVKLNKKAAVQAREEEQESQESQRSKLPVPDQEQKKSYLSEFEKNVVEKSFAVLKFLFWAFVVFIAISWVFHQLFDSMPPDDNGDSFPGTGR